MWCVCVCELFTFYFIPYIFNIFVTIYTTNHTFSLSFAPSFSLFFLSRGRVKKKNEKKKEGRNALQKSPPQEGFPAGMKIKWCFNRNRKSKRSRRKINGAIPFPASSTPCSSCSLSNLATERFLSRVVCLENTTRKRCFLALYWRCGWWRSYRS